MGEITIPARSAGMVISPMILRKQLSGNCQVRFAAHSIDSLQAV
jgi:hypothetical protein